jgi:hypothetical protein
MYGRVTLGFQLLMLQCYSCILEISDCRSSRHLYVLQCNCRSWDSLIAEDYIT